MIEEIDTQLERILPRRRSERKKSVGNMQVVDVRVDGTVAKERRRTPPPTSLVDHQPLATVEVKQKHSHRPAVRPQAPGQGRRE